MGKISEWIKLNAKDGADISEVEALIQASTVEGIDSKEKAYDFMLKNDQFKRALDYTTQEAVKGHDLKFQTEKLPTILEEERNKIKNELNPPKTEAEKKLAALEQQMKGMELKEKQLELEKTLRAKAKELDFPAERAEKYAAYGENAVSEMESAAEFWKSQISSVVEAKTKELYGNNPPPNRSTSDPAKVKSRSDFDALSPTEKTSFVSGGGSVEDN